MDHSNTQCWLSRPNGGSPVDAFEQHRELCAAQRDLAAGRLWPDKASSLQSFGQKTEPVAIEPEELHDIAAPSAKDEHMARERLLFEYRLHLRTQPLKATPHVG